MFNAESPPVRNISIMGWALYIFVEIKNKWLRNLLYLKLFPAFLTKKVGKNTPTICK